MNRRTGFTLAEMTIVIGTIAVLAAVLFPAFARAREQTRAGSCKANLFSAALALRVYASDHDGRLPLGPAGPMVLVHQGLVFEWTFLCPTASNGVSFPGMGPPPAPSSAGRATPPDMAGPPAGPPSPGGVPAGGMGGPTPTPPAPEMPPGAMPALPEEPAYQEPAYVYQPGLSLARPTHELLMADARARHNARANVLFANGSLRSLPEAQWSALLSPQLARLSGWASERTDQPLLAPSPGEGGGSDD